MTKFIRMTRVESSGSFPIWINADFIDTIHRRTPGATFTLASNPDAEACAIDVTETPEEILKLIELAK